MYDNRPLESLAAFALCFAAGLMSVAALAGYGRWIRHQLAQEGNAAQSQTAN